MSIVCGEDCLIQTCIICATEDARDTVVDVLLNRKLGEIDSEAETLDEILITLPSCHHVFTVETLDGVCDMTDYYQREGLEGQWLGFKEPPTGFRKPPTCPTCRAAITSPRYGRTFKRADLDILENNVASQMSHSLQEVVRLIASISHAELENTVATEAARVQVAHNAVSAAALKSQKKARGAILKDKQMPVPVAAINPTSKLYSISPSAAQAWRRVNTQMLQAYTNVRRIAETRSAHVHAWEAAFSCLYEDEMNASMEDPAHAPRHPEEHAMRMARMKVGQPYPRADKRFVVEAFWITLDLRFTLANLAQKWLEAANSREPSYPPEQRLQWAIYVQFMLRTCSEDAQIAFDIAENSGSLRQGVKSTVYDMRAELEVFRFNVLMTRQFGHFEESRNELRTTAAAKAALAEQKAASTTNKYLNSRRTEQDRKWVDDNFIGIANIIVEEWSAVERSLRLDTFYQDVSLEEKMAVIRALSENYDFSELLS